MTVRVVTDSCADITTREAKELDISVVPVYVRFGEGVYRDGVDISSDEFYRRLTTDPVHPNTSAPSPGDFAREYQRLSRETDEIVSVHVTSKESATHGAALAGKEIAQKGRCRIEVVDSRGVTMWQGLVALAAARAARAGYSLNQVVSVVQETVQQMRAMAFLDTMRYISKGGRLGKAFSAVDSLLHVKVMITLREGKIRPLGLLRSRSKGLERLFEFVRSAPQVENLVVMYSTLSDDVRELVDRTGSLFPGVVPRLRQLGPGLGVHTGPGAVVAVLQEAGESPETRSAPA